MEVKRMLLFGCAGIGVVVLIGCGLLYRWLFPPCGQPPDDPNVEVIVSDCTRPFLISTSPDGKYLMYTDDRGYWLRNLITGEEQKMSVAADFWLTDSLVLQTTGGGDNRQFLVYDLTDGTKTPLQWIYGRHNFAGVLPAFQRAEIVYYAPDERDNFAVALAPNFKNIPRSNYVLSLPPTFQGGLGEEESILNFLQDNHISYVEFRSEYFYRSPPLPSHDGRLLAKGSWIYDLAGSRIVLPADGNSSITGWAHDDSGVYLQHPMTGGPVSVMTPFLLWPKDQPILKLKVPFQYLSPEAQAADEARQAEQKAAQQRQAIITWGSAAGALAMLGGGWFFWRHRNRRNPKQPA